MLLRAQILCKRSTFKVYKLNNSYPQILHFSSSSHSSHNYSSFQHSSFDSNGCRHNYYYKHYQNKSQNQNINDIHFNFQYRSFCNPSSTTNSQNPESPEKNKTSRGSSKKMRREHHISQSVHTITDEKGTKKTTKNYLSHYASIGNSNYETFSQHEEVSNNIEIDDYIDPNLSGKSNETNKYYQASIKSAEFCDTINEMTSTLNNVGMLNEDGSHVNILLNQSTNETPTLDKSKRSRKLKKDDSSSQEIIEHLVMVGNPTAAEIEWRKSQLTPYALIIHESRLLPVLSEKKEDEKGFRASAQSYYRRIKEYYRDTIRSNEKWNDYDKKITESLEDANVYWDTSQNYYLVRFRSLVDRMNLQTEPSRAMEIMRETFNDDFWVEDFLPEFKERMLKDIIQAYLSEDMEYLNLVCCGEALVFCTNMIEQRRAGNVLMDDNILWLEDPTLMDTKIVDKLPQMIIHVQAQVVDCTYDRSTDAVVDGSKNYIAHQNFVMALQPCMDPEYMKSVWFPIQVRSLQTAKVRALV